MTVTIDWFTTASPQTAFAPQCQIPVARARALTPAQQQALAQHVLTLEQTIVSQDPLTTAVPKNSLDPYQLTQHWKQHNLVDDQPVEGNETITKFPPNPLVDLLVDQLRQAYLALLAQLNLPRRRCYIYGWANVLTQGQLVSAHQHMTHDESYLSVVYHVTQSASSLILEIPQTHELMTLPTQAGQLLFFPAWVPHWTDTVQEPEPRISLAFDIVTQKARSENPWRYYALFDDPDQQIMS